MKARLDAQMFLQSLRETERLPPARYFQFAERLLLELAAHAMNSPFWARRLAPLVEADGGLSLANWADVPPLGIVEAEAAGGALAAEGEGEETPKTIDAGDAAGPFRRRDETAVIADLCMFERILEIAGISLNARMFDLLDPPAFAFDDWIWNSTFEKAAVEAFPARWPGDLHLEMLRLRHARGVLRAAPQTLAGLLAALDRHGGPPPKVMGIVAMGEPLDATLHARLADRFAAKVAAIWHDPRLGVVGFRDPAGEGWRISLGTQFVEVIDDNGRPCAEGGPGEVAVTTFYAHATPAIRFLPGQRATVINGEGGLPRLSIIPG